MSRDLAIRALLAIGRRADVGAEEYRALRTVLRQYLTQARPGISEADLSDAVDESVSRLLARPDALAGLDETTVLGYVLRSARNAQIDRWRSTRLEVLDDLAESPPRSGTGEEDDAAILALMDESASLATVRQLLEDLQAEGDSTTIRVIVTWLDLAAGMPSNPTAREVAVRLGLAHSTVVRAMQRARSRLSGHSEGMDLS